MPTPHPRLPRALWLVLVAPMRGMEALAHTASSSRALGVLASLAASWSALSLALHMGGHAPSGPLLLPIARADYYLAQALFVAPLLAVGLAAATVASRLVGRGLGASTTRWRVDATTSAAALAVPATLAWVLPDALVVSVLGFDALAGAMRYYVPGAFAWTLVLLAVAAHVTRRLSWARAFGSAGTAVVAFAFVVTPFLR